MKPADTITALAEKHNVTLQEIIAKAFNDQKTNAEIGALCAAAHLRFLTAALDEMGVERALATCVQQLHDQQAMPDDSHEALYQSTLTTIRAVKDAGKDL